MVAKKRAEEMLVKFSDVTIGERAASVSISTKLRKEDPAAHVAHLWAEFYKRRLSGSIVLGDDMPNQKRMDDRPTIENAFDTGKPSFGEEECSMRVTFDRTGIDPELLIQFSHKTGWLLVDAINDIPKASKVKEEKAAKKKNAPYSPGKEWRKEGADRLGIDNRLVKKMFDAGVKRVGDVLELIDGKFEGTTLTKLKITKVQLTKMRQQIGLYLEDRGEEIPW